MKVNHFTVFVEGKGPEITVAAWCRCAECLGNPLPKHWFFGTLRPDFHLNLTPGHSADDKMTFRQAVGEARGY